MIEVFSFFFLIFSTRLFSLIRQQQQHRSYIFTAAGYIYWLDWLQYDCQIFHEKENSERDLSQDEDLKSERDEFLIAFLI
jgi:hypothetical protein